MTISQERHSRMLLAGIQKKGLDARLRGHDGRYWTSIYVELYIVFLRVTSWFSVELRVIFYPKIKITHSQITNYELQISNWDLVLGSWDLILRRGRDSNPR